MSIDHISIATNSDRVGNRGEIDFSFIVDDITGEVDQIVPVEQLMDMTTSNGLLNDRGLEYFKLEPTKPGVDVIPEGTFRGGPQFVFPEGLTFRGGSQVGSDIGSTRGGAQKLDASIQRHELNYLQEVVSEIFDGRHDLGEVDMSYLLDSSTGMPQTLRSLFINRPGLGGGRSSIRHIFRGDKNGGLHVPAFATELEHSQIGYENPHLPFDAHVSINGISKFRVVTDSNPRIEPAVTSMFPRNLDSLAVLQCVVDAWQHKAEYRTSSVINKKYEVSHVYEVPVKVDDAKPLTIRLVTDGETREEKIKTAFPVVPN